MIKANAAAKVKAVIFGFAALMAASLPVLAQTTPEQKQNDVKPIEAEEFKAKLIRKSTSGRVLLFEDPGENNPKPGKVLLIKQDQEEIVAVRVLKNYYLAKTDRFAAKVVLPFKEINVGSEYRALKKLGDKMLEMIREREQRVEDPDKTKSDEDLAEEIAPDDNELDRGIPKPAPPKKKEPQEDEGKSKKKANAPEPLFTKEGDEITPESIEVADEDEPYPELTAQDQTPIDPHKHAVTLQYGALNNVDKNNNATSYNGLGLRYAYTPAKQLLFKRRGVQDSLSLEASAFYYTIGGFQTTNDQVTVVPAIATLRYNLIVGENFTFFGYGGVLQNLVTASATTTKAALLATTKPAAGGGLMLRIGPSWLIRADYGLDLFAVGIMLKF